jgi:hypothetical protein
MRPRADELADIENYIRVSGLRRLPTAFAAPVVDALPSREEAARIAAMPVEHPLTRAEILERFWRSQTTGRSRRAVVLLRSSIKGLADRP